MLGRSGGLWRHPAFLRLWAGQAISLVGSHIGEGALRYTAILVLAATPAQMSALSAARVLPMLLVGLFAGVLVDRLRRRSLLIAADIGRALLLLSIPLAYLLGLLQFGQLYLVAALAGVLTIIFDVAYEAFLPQVVAPAQLVEGNSKLGVSASLAEIAGPPLGGGLVQLLSAPLAVAVDAVSFLGSAALLWGIGAPAPPPAEPAPPTAVWRDISAGFAVIWRAPLLRALLGVQVCFNLGGGVIGSLYDLYLISVLALPPVLVGVTIGAGGLSALAGALLAGRVVGRLGLGPTMVGSLLLSSLAGVLLPLAQGPPLTALTYILLGQLTDAAITVYLINETSLRQAATPEAARGRVGASFQFIGLGAQLCGIALGGWLGQALGLRAAMGVAVAVGSLGALWLARSPVRRLRGLPERP